MRAVVYVDLETVMVFVYGRRGLTSEKLAKASVENAYKVPGCNEASCGTDTETCVGEAVRTAGLLGGGKLIPSCRTNYSEKTDVGWSLADGESTGHN